jgi:hypothetical protein
MPQLLPTQAVFVEERYLASIFYARLRSVCAAKAAIAHVDVSQKFQAYAANFYPGNANAQGDVDTVLKLLNDDGRGLGALKNTAVGYHLSNVARIFKEMAQLPADLLNVPATAPVDMAARFNEIFVDAQMNLEDRPQLTGNDLLDMIRNLVHLRLVIAGIKNFVEHPLAANAQIIYSPPTKAQYDSLRAQLADLCTDALKKLGRAAKIIERYANPANAPAIKELMANIVAGTYRITSANSEKVLDVSGGVHDDGARIIQYAWHGGLNQVWRLEPLNGVDQGYYRILSLGSGKCLDVAGSAQEDGGEIIQYAYYNTDNQKWRLIVVDGGFVIQAKHSGKVLDVPASSHDDGVPVIQYMQHNGNNQRWILVEVNP